MRKSIGIISGILFFLQVAAQQNAVDSLHQLLRNAKEDTSKVNLLNQLSWNFIETKPDSNLFYGNQALELSRKIHYTEGEIFALVNTSSGFTLSGNYSKALENSLEALKKSEAINKEKFLASSYFNISLVYSVQEDHRTSIPYGLKALEIYKKLQDSLNIANELINIGVAYRELNEMDSARYYFNQSLELSLKLKKIDNISAIYLNLGIISLKMKQYDLGISYCRLATPYFKATNNPLFLSSIYNVLGDLFDSTGQQGFCFLLWSFSSSSCPGNGFTTIIVVFDKATFRSFQRK
jgi:tetratricopeptide (TPR) repeat protein